MVDHLTNYDYGTEEYYNITASFNKLGSLLAFLNNREYDLMELFSIIGRTDVSPIIHQNVFDDLIPLVKEYGISNFCQKIQLDDYEDGVDKMGDLFYEASSDDKYISFGAHLDAIFTVVWEAIERNELTDMIQFWTNTTATYEDKLKYITEFIHEDDIDLMEAWDVISGHGKVLLSVMAKIVTGDENFEDTIFAGLQETAHNYYKSKIDELDEISYDNYRKRREIVDVRRDPDNSHSTRDSYSYVSNLADTILSSEIQFLNELGNIIEIMAQHPLFNFPSSIYKGCDLYYEDCLSQFYDDIMDGVDDVRRAVFCGDYPTLGETCEEWDRLHTAVDVYQTEYPFEEYPTDEYPSEEYPSEISKYGLMTLIASVVIIIFAVIGCICTCVACCRCCRKQHKYVPLENNPEKYPNIYNPVLSKETKTDNRLEDV